MADDLRDHARRERIAEIRFIERDTDEVLAAYRIDTLAYVGESS